MKKTFFSIVMVWTACVQQLVAQDPQFSQFYAAPTYLNPALAGAGLGARFVANFRAQWPALPGAFTTYAASYDQDIPQYRSGVGIRFASDNAGAGSLSSNTVALQYCYIIPVSRKWRLRTGTDLGFISRSVDFARLTFPDQVSLTGLNDMATSENLNFENVNFFDVGMGGVLYNETFWMGFAVHHLNQPEQSLRAGTSNALPAKFTLHGGVQIPINSPYQPRADERVRALSPAFNYKQQGDFSQLDLGLYLNYEPVIFGIWYRGLPILKDNQYGYFNQDALIFLFGLKQKNYSVGYSYDLTISKMGGSTGGSHELSLTLEFETTGLARKRRRGRNQINIPCPKF